MGAMVDSPGGRGRRGAIAVDGRLHRPDLLVIGAMNRNTGKTELACRLIGRHAASTPVVGLKVTTVERTDGHCPHGGDGCGVCSSLTESWIVSRELDRESPKDTCRLLKSGARQVYWVRVLRSQLADGAIDLLTRIPTGCVGVCESNGLVSVVEPGLFLLVRAAGSSRPKPSARAVAHLAERIVVSDGRSFDLDLDRISVVDGQWALRREACAVVIDGVGERSGAGHTAALRRTRESLEPQFDRVVAASGTVGRTAGSQPTTSLPDPPGTWCLVTPPVAGGVPPGLVNAMFRRRAEGDVVVAATRSEGREVCLVLCRRGALSDVMDRLGRGPDAVAALGERYAVREVRPVPPGSRTGIERLPATERRAGATGPTSDHGARAR